MDFKVKEDILLYYLYWMKERMDIWWRRYEDNPLKVVKTKELFDSSVQKIWTEDKLLSKYKFTNVYRCLDRVSQYLLKEVIYNGKTYSKEDMLFRILIFKIFNKIETFEYLQKEYGEIVIETFNFDEWSKYLSNSPFPIWGNAYIMNAVSYPNTKIKHEKFFYSIQDYIFKKDYIHKIIDSKSLKEVYNILRLIPMWGDFIAYQYSIDLNYSEVINFGENDFVKVGLGAQRFIDKAFVFDKKQKEIYEDIVKWIADNIDSLREKYSNKFNKNLFFKALPGRKPTLIDYQNCCCESDKYTRGLGLNVGTSVEGKRIKCNFVENSNKIDYIFPPKWGKVL